VVRALRHRAPPKRTLNEEVHGDRAMLHAALKRAARDWLPAIGSWDEARFDGTLHCQHPRRRALSAFNADVDPDDLKAIGGRRAANRYLRATLSR